MISINHFVLDRYSKWVTGLNVTRAGDIIHCSRKRIVQPKRAGRRKTLSKVDHGLQIYITKSRFETSRHSQALLSTSAFYVYTDVARRPAPLTRPWGRVHRMADKVQKHTCRHSASSDMRTMLQRNGLWSDAVQRHLSDLVQRCNHFIASSTPPPSCKVSLATLCRELNDLMFFVHFYFNQLLLLHMMDAYSGFSTAVVFSDTSMGSPCLAFEHAWLTHSGQLWLSNLTSPLQNRNFGIC